MIVELEGIWKEVTVTYFEEFFICLVGLSNSLKVVRIVWTSVSQTVVRGPQVVLRFCLRGPLGLNISPKKTEKY
jgi:hypothetical protein